MALLAVNPEAEIGFHADYWTDLLRRQAPPYFAAFDYNPEVLDGVQCGIDEARGDAVVLTHPIWDLNPANYCEKLADVLAALETRSLRPRCISVFRALRFPFQLPD
jgi:DEAD/DEAH box helicase domain-containing protein